MLRLDCDNKKLRKIFLGILALGIGLLIWNAISGAMSARSLYKQLAALEKSKGWRVLLCDVGRHGTFVFLKELKGRKRPPITAPGEDPEKAKLLDKLIPPNAVATNVYSNVYIYSVNEQQAKPIFGIGRGDVYHSVADAVFSPDGQHIALWMSTLEDVETRKGKLVLLDGEGRFQEELLEASDGGYLAWSPDGTKLAFAANYRDVPGKINPITRYNKKQASLLRFDLKTRTQHVVIQDGVAGLTSYAWSPDGNEIVYEGVDDEILIYNLDTNKSRVLVSEADGYATWSPSGEWIIYHAADWNYYRIHPDGSGKELLLRNYKQKKRYWLTWEFWRHWMIDAYGPVIWSPDSRYLLYGRISGWGSFDTMLCVMDLKTRRKVYLGEFDGTFPLGSWVKQTTEFKN